MASKAGNTSGTQLQNPERDAGPDSSARRKFEDLPPAAQRALREAEERRKAQDASAAPAKEIGGRGGKDPSRYGDWEIDGRAVDF